MRTKGLTRAKQCKWVEECLAWRPSLEAKAAAAARHEAEETGFELPTPTGGPLAIGVPEEEWPDSHDPVRVLQED